MRFSPFFITFLITFASCKQTKEAVVDKISPGDLCLCCGVNILNQNIPKYECTTLITPVTSEEIKMLNILCETKRKYQRYLKIGWKFYVVPYLGIRGWSLEYRNDFYTDMCQSEKEMETKNLFWLTRYDNYGIPNNDKDYHALGRRIMDEETSEVISQLGMKSTSIYYINDIHNFVPFIMDGFPDISTVRGQTQYLIRRIPMLYELSSPVKLSENSIEIQQEHIGDFIHHNPSSYPQTFALELELPVDVTYETEERLVSDTPLEYRDSNETIWMRTGKYLTETKNFTVTFNVTVKPGHTLTARVWGIWTRFETTFNATLNTTMVKLGSFSQLDGDAKTNVTGKKILIRLDKFFLTDIQDYHSNEVLIISYSAIASILFGISFILTLVLLFLVIRKIRESCEEEKSNRQGYVVLNNESTVETSVETETPVVPVPVNPVAPVETENVENPARSTLSLSVRYSEINREEYTY